MQEEPEKTVRSYNEFTGNRLLPPPDRAESRQPTTEQTNAIWMGMRTVNMKIEELLGSNNKLLKSGISHPNIRFVDSDPSRPDTAAYFSADRHEIVMIIDSIGDNFAEYMKVFIHEYLHFMSHNGRDEYEHLTDSQKISEHNNIGFSRYFGIDIRKGKEGTYTQDYFLAFNEAVTEQLTIDLSPGEPDDGVYSDYRGLLNQVIDDAVMQGFTLTKEVGGSKALSREQVKDYIYRCFFKGDLTGFTELLKSVYEEYPISEEQFGLMTNKHDLPSIIEKGRPHGTPPYSPSDMQAAVQLRLDNKRPEDYVTDIDMPKPDDGGGDDTYGKEYDTFVKERNIVEDDPGDATENGVDTFGFTIYRGESAKAIFEKVYKELKDQIIKYESGEISKQDISDHMDEVLFEKYMISMLSDGFKAFYIYKHSKLDSLE